MSRLALVGLLLLPAFGCGEPERAEHAYLGGDVAPSTEEFARPEPEVIEQDGVVKIISGYMGVPAEEIAGTARDHVGVNVTFTVPLSGERGGGVSVIFFRDGMDQYAKRLLVDGRAIRAVSEFDGMWVGPPEAIPAIARADSIKATLGALRWVRFTPAQEDRLKQMARTAIDRGAPADAGDPNELFW